MKINYSISNGTPPYIAKLQGGLLYTNNHLSGGSYSFNGVVDGIYNFVVTDSTGCDFNYGFIDVNNNAFKVIATQTDLVEGSENISGIEITSKSVTYQITFDPTFQEPYPSIVLIIGYNLVTTESPISIGDSTFGQASFTVSTNGTPIYTISVNSNTDTGSTTGQYTTPSILPTDILTVNVSIATYEEAGDDASSFVEITCDEMFVNGISSIIDTSSFIINNNIA